MTMRSRASVIQELQAKVTAFQTELTEVFNDVLRHTRADRGFLAFEDLNGNLSIVANKGDFWHLNRFEGATGQAVKTGIPRITDAKDAAYRQTADAGTEAFSELIYPVKLGEDVVGAILLDNRRLEPFKKEVHFPILEGFVRNICEILQEQDPWAFRRWWRRHEKSKLDALFRQVQGVVEEVLTQHFGKLDQNKIGARLERLTDDAGLVEERIVLGESAASHEPTPMEIEAAIRRGECKRRAVEVQIHMCSVPFPASGPVLGAVTLSAESKDILSQELEDKVKRGIEKLDYQHLAPSPQADREPAEDFFSLIFDALTSPVSPAESVAAMRRIASDARSLCGADVSIDFAAKPDQLKVLHSDNLVSIKTEEDLLKAFGEAKVCGRPRRILADDWLQCSVVVRERMRGLVKVKRDPDDIGDRYNSGLVVVLAMIIGEIVTKVEE